jgi:SAM-dependent methyltransferase
MLATRYPAATVYTLSSTSTSNPPTSYPAPLNHHSLYVPSLSSATPFPDNYFDAIVSRSIATLLRNDDWARSFFDCMRVLKPGGQLEVLSVDAHLSCEGPKLSAWVDELLTARLEAHGLSRQASDTVLDTMEIVGLENIRRARVALPAHSPKAVVPARPAAPPSHGYGAATQAASQDSADASRMMSFLGRHFYQDLHGKLLQAQAGEEWFWARRDVREECERYKTKMVLTIACALKPSVTPGESYLDI